MKMLKSLHGQTLGDLSDEQNIQQADHELRRAITDAALADWARRWGECAVRRCRELVGKDDDAADDLREAEADALRAETKLAELELAAEALIKALDGAGTEQCAAVDNAIGALENVL